MDAFVAGPLAVPVRVAAPLLAVLAATLLAGWLARRTGQDAAPLLWKMIAAGVVAGRAVFVLRHHDLYREAPWSALDLRDGGFEATAGLIAACVVGAELSRRRAGLRKPLLACVLAGCAVWFGATLAAQALGPAQAPLPALTLPAPDGGAVALRAYAGRPVVVNLWATWCPPCRREMPALRAAQAANPDLHFVFVNQREPAAAVARYLAEHAPGLRNVALDPTGRFAAQAGAVGYPTTLFYDAAGRLRMRHMGELSPASLRDKLDALRAAP